MRFHTQWRVDRDVEASGNVSSEYAASSLARPESLFDKSTIVPRVSNETSVSVLIKALLDHFL